MTKAVMYWSRMRLEVEGHAEYAEPGKDIVCAGVSILTTALVRTLEEQQLRGRLKVEYKSEPGRIIVTADPRMDCLNETKAYFRMAVIGLKMLMDIVEKMNTK